VSRSSRSTRVAELIVAVAVAAVIDVGAAARARTPTAAGSACPGMGRAVRRAAARAGTAAGAPARAPSAAGAACPRVRRAVTRTAARPRARCAARAGPAARRGARSPRAAGCADPPASPGLARLPYLGAVRAGSSPGSARGIQCTGLARAAEITAAIAGCRRAHGSRLATAAAGSGRTPSVVGARS